ncbi:BTAD domain-containing putative transcriptional regulator [Eubacteriales bacterium KG127]
MVEIKYLGITKIVLDGDDITSKFGGKTLALLSLLLVNNSGYVSKEKLISYLWPESTEDAGKYNLRYNLWLIRKLLPQDEKKNELINSVSNGYEINGKYDFSCDVINILRDSSYREHPTDYLESLRKHFNGEFMEGFFFKNCDEYNEFIIRLRRRLEDRKTSLYFELFQRYKDSKHFEKCKLLLDELSQSEPFDEKIAWEYLDIYSSLGQKSAALIYYSEFRNKLAVNLGISPSSELVEKYKEIKGMETEKQISDSKPSDSQNYSVEISSCPNIKYFGLSIIIEKLVEKFHIDLRQYLTEEDLQTLCYIIPSSLKSYSCCLPKEFDWAMIQDIRLARSFYSLIKNISRSKICLSVTIYGESKMDDFSKDLLIYIDSSIKEFTFSMAK